ncbi:MAG: alcohol dehydrogenase catalytic domain-containing protein [Thermomicrobiales bacterium]|nr:alcohol dehydrogenase catalytic domain-containing protein [Thermomicrobiales bacterium]
MRAAVFVAPRTLEVRDVPDLTLGSGEVLIRNQVSGICGSDIHLYEDRIPEFTPRILGKVLGHELCGEVVEVAPDVTNVRVGDRVAVEPLLKCGQCPFCLSGDYHLCPELQHVGIGWSGGFGEYAKAPAENVYPLPDHVSYEDASLLDVLAVGIHAIHVLGIHAGSSVLVFGGGAIGLATAQAAKWAGASTVAIATRSQLARDLATSSGIDLAIDTTREDVGERLREATHGLGPDVAFDAVGGGRHYVQQGIDIVRRGGKVGVLGGFPPQPVELGGDFLIKEVAIVPCYSYGRWGALSEFQIALDGLAAGEFQGRQYISRRFPLEEISRAFEVAQHKDGQDAIKVSIVF